MFGLFRQSAPVPLDPFARWPDARSGIRGLGGKGEAAEAGGVFETAFASFAPGALLLDLGFADLSASHGRMVLAVLALAEGSADEATVQGEVIVDLADLAATQGRYRWPVMARPRHQYAFRGRLIGETDAHATALTVAVDRNDDAAAYERRLATARDAVFGAAAADPTGLIVDAPATLAAVRSQMCTAAQFDEPEYDRWIGLMHRTKHRHRKQWEYVWICRALETLGCLADGARGLGFGCGIEPLPAVFAAHGASVTATDLGAEDRRAQRWQDTSQHLLSLDALADAAICPPERFFDRVEIDAIDMNAIPDDRVGYDFCWSSCSLEHLGSIEAGLRFIERSLGTLRPGGVAVHTTEFNLTSDSRTVTRGGTVLFRRRDIEGFARAMTAAGHEVMPITFDQGDQPEDQFVDMPPYAADLHFKLALKSFVTTSFGLAIRKKG